MNFKNEPWRLLVGIAAIAYIAYMWIDKDLLSVYAALPSEHLLPMATTGALVTVFKVVMFAAVLFLVKIIIGKTKK